VRFSYTRKPDSLGPRTTYPHAIFETATGGVRIDARQLDGPTSSNTGLPAWRTFDPAWITELELLDRQFDPDATFNPDNRHKYFRMRVHCRESM